ncbi:MAG: YibE/F family protein [uncultured Acidimicrobiales bacterium]|uniref:YibE/F family protein n=1 Tax=uncultured Acidimicrobiales bacterium TaxID=310071 RepID=A0A6J4HL83_9ACTN|nr:MAG: YibE/F family protein [uncultured Acidimicrobiales bacterium]
MRRRPFPPLARVLGLLVVVVGAFTALGLAVLWPSGDAPDLSGSTAGLDYVDAQVTAVEVVGCTDPAEGLPTECQAVSVRVSSGPDEGEPATFFSSLADFRAPSFSAGDRLVLVYNRLAPAPFQYVFVEFQRDTPLLLLGLAFVLVVVAFGRWKGVRALAGLGVSLAVIVGFLLPSLLRDHNAIAVALVTTSVVAFASLYLAHGVSAATTVALLGTLTSVVAIALLANVMAAAARLTGLSGESFQVLRVTAEAIEPRGILIAGVVIGALGVLDDVTVTQVSAVTELRRAKPDLSRRDLYRSAIRIGRDHVASTVNTLVLAYVGASLALMLFFLQEGRSITQVLGREVVAIEVVRMLVGSIGLILSVPLTTWLAVVAGVTSDTDGHGHGSSSS